MRQTRFYCDNIGPGRITLAGAEAHHLIDVMRLGPGASVELFDGKGTTAQAVIAETAAKTAALTVEKIQKHTARTGGQVIIAASVAKGRRFDWLIGKCTELGVDHIAPVIFKRTVKQARNPSIVERYNNLAISAAKQCRRSFLPKITAPAKLEETLAMLENDYPDAQLLLGGFGQKSTLVTMLANYTKSTAVIIGPEGGLADDEIATIKESGATEVRLNDNVLRVETAGVAFAAILCALRDSAG